MADATTNPPGFATASDTMRRSLLQHNWGWLVARGVAAIILGLIALFAPGLTLFVLAMVFAAFSFIDGIAHLVSGIRGARHKQERYGWLILSGLAGIAVGVLFVIWPLVSTLVYAMLVVTLIAVWALLTGAFQLAAAVRLRREIEGEWLLGASGVLSILLGLALLVLSWVMPGLTILSVGWLIAFYAFASGVALLVLGFRLRKRRNAEVDAPVV